MRLVLILAIAVAVDAFFLRVHHASTKTIRRRAPMLYVAATLAPANNTDSAVSGDRKNAATRKWNVRFKELEKFHRRFGHFEANEPKALANWVRNQRMQYRYMHQGGKESLCFLTTERIQKLEGIGFVWNPQESKWNRMYAQLVDYRNHYGDCNVPSRWEENTKLSQWVSSQRFKYKARQRGRQIGEAIKEEQIELLNSLDFSWNPKGDTWWTMYEALKEYKLKHDTCAVPQSHPTLGAWVRHQRRACRELVLWHTIDKAKEEIDFCWLPDQNDPQDPPTDIFDYKK